MKNFLFISEVIAGMFMETHPTSLPAFLLTKHLMDYNNVFLNDFSYSKSVVCSAPLLKIINCV